MATLNEVKEQMIVVNSVGEFTNALQQIATLHMMQLRDKVLASRPYVEAANEMLGELQALRNAMQTADLIKIEKQKKQQMASLAARSAVIVITSNQGLTGRYNIEIYQKIEKILEKEQGSDFYIIGKKGQEYFQNGRYKVQSFPFEVPDNFTIESLRRLTTIFDLYQRVTLVYSRYINSATREVVALSVVSPDGEDVAIEDIHEKPNRFIYEPDIDLLIEGVSKKLRDALFQQQILDARLAQFSSQMIGMKTASDNATSLLADLRVDYNKQRRKMIDKKIGEVFAGSALW
ncbi:MAG: atpG [Patescibacteria group bacterium]|jgi:F-type H+-transporting ATPase subunit gamma|nr:atpG [Patescibacteria group bacterium]